MNCPKCKTITLKKTRDYSSPLSCKQCGGIWITGPIANYPADSIQEDHTLTTRDGQDEKTGLCPEGHGILIRGKVELEESFYLEKCTTCGGIWFDKGELTRLVEGDMIKILPEIWSRAWQIKQRKLKNRDSYLKVNEQLLGTALFEELMNVSLKLKTHPEKNRAIALLQNEIE